MDSQVGRLFFSCSRFSMRGDAAVVCWRFSELVNTAFMVLFSDWVFRISGAEVRSVSMCRIFVLEVKYLVVLVRDGYYEVVGSFIREFKNFIIGLI